MSSIRLDDRIAGSVKSTEYDVHMRGSSAETVEGERDISVCDGSSVEGLVRAKRNIKVADSETGRVKSNLGAVYVERSMTGSLRAYSGLQLTSSTVLGSVRVSDGPVIVNNSLVNKMVLAAGDVLCDRSSMDAVYSREGEIRLAGGSSAKELNALRGRVQVLDSVVQGGVFSQGDSVEILGSIVGGGVLAKKGVSVKGIVGRALGATVVGQNIQVTKGPVNLYRCTVKGNVRARRYVELLDAKVKRVTIEMAPKVRFADVVTLHSELGEERARLKESPRSPVIFEVPALYVRGKSKVHQVVFTGLQRGCQGVVYYQRGAIIGKIENGTKVEIAPV